MKSKVLFTLWLLVFAIPGVILYQKLLVLYAGEMNVNLRMSGKVAMIYLTLSLLISPIATYISHKGFWTLFIQLRKIFGLLGCYFFLFHLFQYTSLEWVFHQKYHTDIGFSQYFFGNILSRNDALSWFLAGCIILILWTISNTYSMKRLGWKLWKNIQTLAYPLFVIVLIHIALASRFDSVYMLLTTILVMTRTFAFFHNKKEGWAQSSSTRYLCVPCWYIYDEALGDPDSGIQPGTRFEDIPEDWRCPVCGVSKADFSPVSSSTQKVVPENQAKLVQKEMLTAHVVKLVFVTSSDIAAVAWQFINLVFPDPDGEFRRSYSVVYQKWNTIILIIKLTEYGRGSRKLRNLEVGDTLGILGPFGSFTLKDTSAKKVFLATGTGLSPIIHMMESLPSEVSKVLYFGVEKSSDIFYQKELSLIENLEVHIFLSREENPQYHFGRIDVSNLGLPMNTEFYICGNPAMIQSSSESLRAQWYTSIFHELFS